MDQHRAERVSETVREELAEIIGFELKHAHVLVALSGDEREQKAAMAALDHARHYLRHELARRLNLRKIPELHFEPGPGADVANRVELLLKRAKKLRRPTENQP